MSTYEQRVTRKLRTMTTVYEQDGKDAVPIRSLQRILNYTVKHETKKIKTVKYKDGTLVFVGDQVINAGIRKEAKVVGLLPEINSVSIQRNGDYPFVVPADQLTLVMKGPKNAGTGRHRNQRRT